MHGYAQPFNQIACYNHDGNQLAVILTENTEYGRKRLQPMEEILSAMAVNVVGFPVDLPADDFSPIIVLLSGFFSAGVLFFLLHCKGRNIFGDDAMWIITAIKNLKVT